MAAKSLTATHRGGTAEGTQVPTWGWARSEEWLSITPMNDNRQETVTGQGSQRAEVYPRSGTSPIPQA